LVGLNKKENRKEFHTFRLVSPYSQKIFYSKKKIKITRVATLAFQQKECSIGLVPIADELPRNILLCNYQFIME